MQAIIMAGGRGERLLPLTKKIPKPMVPILDKPILYYLISKLKEFNINNIIITLCYKGEIIENEFGSGADMGVSIRYVYEDSPLGTAGSVKNAESLIHDDFLVLSGDGYTDMNIEDLISFHYSHRGIATLATVRVPDPELYGNVFTDKKGKIIAFDEKPIKPLTDLVNTGIYVFDRKILKKIPKGYSDFSKNIFPRLIGKIYSYESDCYWSDIGNLQSYYLTNYKVAEEYIKSIP